MSIESVSRWLSAKDAPNGLSLALGVAVVAAILVIYFSSSAEQLKVPRGEVLRRRSPFVTHQQGPQFWEIGRQLGEYWSSVPSGNDMSGVTDNAARVAAGPGDQHASDIAMKKSKESMVPKAPSAESRLLSIAMNG